ncbi:MAG: flavin reductase family protein [Vicinamibacterales bacterium]
MTTHLGDELHGMTANAVTSVSLDPLLILVCVDKTADTHDILSQAGVFTVNILGREQQELSKKFATKRDTGTQKLDGVPHKLGSNGCPILDGALAYLDCITSRQLDGGDHTIFLGQVVDARELNDDEPLLFYSGRFGRLAPEPP